MISMFKHVTAAAAAVHNKLVRSARVIFAAVGLVILSGAFDALPVVTTAHAQIEPPTGADVRGSQGTEGDNVIKTANKVLKFYFVILALVFIGALGWAGWQAKQDKDIAPVKWTMIGGAIFAMAGAMGKLVVSWMG